VYRQSCGEQRNVAVGKCARRGHHVPDLPARVEEAVTVAAAPQPRPRRRAPARFLLVEDERLVRVLARKSSAGGYRVLVAEGGAEALELAAGTMAHRPGGDRTS